MRAIVEILTGMQRACFNREKLYFSEIDLAKYLQPAVDRPQTGTHVVEMFLKC